MALMSTGNRGEMVKRVIIGDFMGTAPMPTQKVNHKWPNKTFSIKNNL